METLMPTESTVNIPVSTFNRMVRALAFVESVMKEKQEAEAPWVSEQTAMKMLGCSKRHLFNLKIKGTIIYKAVGKKHQYYRKSIDKYNQIMSTL